MEASPPLRWRVLASLSSTVVPRAEPPALRLATTPLRRPTSAASKRLVYVDFPHPSLSLSEAKSELSWFDALGPDYPSAILVITGGLLLFTVNIV